MALIRDVIYEAWFFRLSGSVICKEKNGKKFFKSKGSWREKYFILVKLGEELFLEWYDKKPSTNNVHPKDHISLWPSYRLLKCHTDRYVCTVSTPTQEIHVGATDQSSIDTFSFNIQTQTILRDNLEGLSFTVLPENTLDQERLGAVGSVCILHVSPWGISLALQQSRSLIAHWPLRCIRSYESDSRGHFSLDCGKKSPFGEGSYVFQTRRGHDDELYNVLDNYVMQAASLADNYPAESVDEDQDEYNHLKRITLVHPRPRESVRASMYCADLYDHIQDIQNDHGPSERESVVSTMPDVVSDSTHADAKKDGHASTALGRLSFDPPPAGEPAKSDLMNFSDYPQLISPTERRQIMIKPRTLLDQSVVTSQVLPKPLIDGANQYEQPDEVLKSAQNEKRSKPPPPTIPPPGPFTRLPTIPKRLDSKNVFQYEDADNYKVQPVEYEEAGIPNQPVEYEEPGIPSQPAPPVPDEIADIPRMPPPPVPLALPVDLPNRPPPPIPTKAAMSTFIPKRRQPVVRENTYVDEGDISPYIDPDMPEEPPPPVPRKPPPVPPFPTSLASDNDNFNEYALMSGSGQNVTVSGSKKYEDPYADAQDVEAIRKKFPNIKANDSVEYLGPDSDEYLGMDSLGSKATLSGNMNSSVEYLAPSDSNEYLGMDSLRENASQIQLRRSPEPMMDRNDYGGGDEYLKMTDLRKSLPPTNETGSVSVQNFSKTQSMYEINQNPRVVDIDIDGPPLIPDISVTPVKGYRGKDINRNTIGDPFKTWSHRSRAPICEPDFPQDDDDDDAGYLLLPQKISRNRLQSHSCEELSERMQQKQQPTKPNEEGYFEIDDDGVVKDDYFEIDEDGVVQHDVPMPFTNLLDMKQVKRGSQENLLGATKLTVPTKTRFQRSISNPDVAGKGRKASHGKKESEEPHQKRVSKLSNFLYGTLRKKKSKSKLNTDCEGSAGSSPGLKPMKAIPPREKIVKSEYKSPKEKPEKQDKHEKHKRKTSTPSGGHKDIIGGIQITPKGKSFVKPKGNELESSPQRGTSYPDSRVLRTPSPNMGRRLPSLPSEFSDNDFLHEPRGNVKHAQSQPNLI